MLTTSLASTSSSATTSVSAAAAAALSSSSSSSAKAGLNSNGVGLSDDDDDESKSSTSNVSHHSLVNGHRQHELAAFSVVNGVAKAAAATAAVETCGDSAFSSDENGSSDLKSTELLKDECASTIKSGDDEASDAAPLLPRLAATSDNSSSGFDSGNEEIIDGFTFLTFELEADLKVSTNTRD